ncbi:hypothetical protein CF319_g2389 [Tilletia indica]|nr:hypothetical protein CF319_g2389 [Tilletia indica]
MQYVGRLVSSVYNSITPNINPATLSGAIDIIVVQRQVKRDADEAKSSADGSSAEQQSEFTTELASTPFHVRFGKMSVLRPAERKVTLHLNGSPEPLPFHMKVGETGEAFFVLEVDEEDSADIPDALVTSPLLSATGSPAPSPGLEGLDGIDDDTRSSSGTYDVEPLDLGASAVTEIDPTRAASQAALASHGSEEDAAAAIARLSLDDTDLDSDVRSAAASSQRTAVEKAVPVSTKELDVMLDMDGYKVTGEAGQDHSHHHFSHLLRRAAQEEDREDDDEEELRREAEKFFGRGAHQRTLSNPEDLSHRLLARSKSDPAIDVTAAAAAADLDGHDLAEKIMDKVARGPAAGMRAKADVAAAAAAAATTKSKTFIKTLRLSSDQLKTLNLKKGLNTISFSVTSSYSGVATCTARIFLWDSSFQVVISDIDGTITKSDALGHVFTMIGRDWTHLGVAKLYTDVARNGYHMMYLTSRAIGQADVTRDYLKNINQNGYRLPEGPVIMSPDRLIASLHREVILRKPEVFKMACLRDIARLFGCDFRGAPAAGGHHATTSGGLVPPTSAQAVGAELQKHDLRTVAATHAHNAKDSSTPTPFYAGFGNRITDALSYRSVNVPSTRIFTIDWNGEVKMEWLDTAGFNTSYVNLTDAVDHHFPPVRAAEVSNPRQREFNDVSFWRQPIEEIELPLDELSPPVSPALSARSGLSIRSSISIRSSASKRSATTSVLEMDEQRSPGGSGGGERGGRLSRFGLSSLGLSRRESTSVTPEPRNPAPSSAGTWSSPQKNSKSPSSGATAGRGGIPFPESTSSPDVLMDDDDPLLAQGEVRFDWK